MQGRNHLGDLGEDGAIKKQDARDSGEDGAIKKQDARD
jgi:hypothetical protein